MACNSSEKLAGNIEAIRIALTWEIQANQQKSGEIIIAMPGEGIKRNDNIQSIRPLDEDDETECRRVGIGR